MKRFITITAGIVVAAAVGCGLLFAIVMTTTQGVASTGDAFMTALQEQNLDDAYALFAPDLQSEVSYADFETTFGGVALSEWSFNSREVENNLGRVSGSATIDDNAFNVRLEFINTDEGWQILGYDFAPSN